MGTLPDLRTFPPDDLLGLFTCQRGYLQGYKTSQIASVAICGRSCHIMPVLMYERIHASGSPENASGAAMRMNKRLRKRWSDAQCYGAME